MSLTLGGCTVPNDIPEIPVKLPEGSSVPGNTPVIIIGPNGSGKTQLAVQIQGLNQARFINAIRDITTIGTAPLTSLQDATNAAEAHQQRALSRYGQYGPEITHMLAKYKAEESAISSRFLSAHASDPNAQPDPVKLHQLTAFWQELFPGRSLDTATNNFSVTSDLGDNGAYGMAKMSDGERSAFYLAALVLDADQEIIIIDEPELYFHTRLAVDFWNALEEAKPDQRFVYVTHDLSFALSRRDPKFLIKRTVTAPPRLLKNNELPPELIKDLISAGTMSIYATRVVFCEGTTDAKILSAWFADQYTAVMPVGGCGRVIRSTSAFNETKLLKGLVAIGVVDRDYSPDEYFDKLSSSIHAIPFHEIEALLCSKDVFYAVGVDAGLAKAELDAKYAAAMEGARSGFKDGQTNYQIVERFKCRMHSAHQVKINSIRSKEKFSEMQDLVSKAFGEPAEEIDWSAILEEEQKRVTDALAGPDADFLRILPGRSYFSHFYNALGLNEESYIRAVTKLLRAGSKDLILALENVLPSRTP